MKTKHGEKIDFKHNLKEYLSLLGKYKFMALLVVFFAILHESRKLVEKFIYKVIIDNSTEFAAGTLLVKAFVSLLIIIAIIYAVLMVLDFVFIWFKEHFLINLTAKMMQDLKVKYFNHILELHHDFHTTHKTGSMISRLLRGSWTIDRMNDTLVFQFAPLLINIIIVSLSLIYFDLFSAVVVFIVSIIFVTYGFYLQKLQQEANLFAVKKEDIEKANVADFLTNIDSIKYYGKEKSIQKKFKNISGETREATLKHWNFFKWYGSVLSIILAVGTFFIIYFSLKRFLSGEITLGTLVFIYTAYIGLMNPMWGFNHGIRS